MKLNFLRNFGNPLSEYRICKTISEYIGYSSSYLPKLEHAQWVSNSNSANVLELKMSNPKWMSNPKIQTTFSL